MNPDKKRRQGLADFLRSRRAALSPADAGLPLRGRRRSVGTTREEVAQLAGISVCWYTWLEQAREVTASPRCLDRLGLALRLNARDRARLFALGIPELPRDLAREAPEAHSDRTSVLKKVTAMAKRLLGAASRVDIARTMTDELCAIAQPSFCAWYLAYEAGPALWRCVHSSGEYATALRSRSYPDRVVRFRQQTLSGRVFNRSVSYEAEGSEPDFALSFGCPSFAAAPIKIGEELIGLIGYSLAEPHAFSESELAPVEFVASLTTLAMQLQHSSDLRGD